MRRLAPGVALPDDSQPFQCQKFVDMLDVLGPSADQTGKPARSQNAGVMPHFRKQFFQNPVHQAEITVVKARLQTCYSIRANDSRRLSYIDPRQPGGASE